MLLRVRVDSCGSNRKTPVDKRSRLRSRRASRCSPKGVRRGRYKPSSILLQCVASDVSSSPTYSAETSNSNVEALSPVTGGAAVAVAASLEGKRVTARCPWSVRVPSYARSVSR